MLLGNVYLQCTKWLNVTKKCVLISNMYPKIKFTAKNWSDLYSFYGEVILWNFSLRNYFFFLLFFAEFELLMFHNNIVKFQKK